MRVASNYKSDFVCKNDIVLYYEKPPSLIKLYFDSIVSFDW